ncbi:pyridoxamine 5'-phosphate oxidase [Sinorhizobium medicae]|nr:pyridoxamine 5'-phosphate oxidase [Sinorhizobium medicae]
MLLQLTKRSERGLPRRWTPEHLNLSEKIRKIDFCMLSTREAGDGISTRPMSNNGDVEYDGDSWFFSFEDTRKVAAIGSDPRVSLSLSAPPSLLGKPGIFVAIDGRASIIRDKAMFEEHWVAELERWFPQGTKTPGLVLIKVHAGRLEYWDGEDNEVVTVS